MSIIDVITAYGPDLFVMLLPALLIRFVFMRRPDRSGMVAIIVTAIWIGLSAFEENPRHGLIFYGLTAVVSVLIFVLGPASTKLKRRANMSLGIRCRAVSETLVAGAGLPADHGVLIAVIEPGGVADKAGLQADDVLISLDSKMVTPTENALAEILSHISQGQRVPAMILRQGTIMSTVITF